MVREEHRVRMGWNESNTDKVVAIVEIEKIVDGITVNDWRQHGHCHEQIIQDKKCSKTLILFTIIFTALKIKWKVENQIILFLLD